jgi:hypothetical protein
MRGNNVRIDAEEGNGSPLLIVGGCVARPILRQQFMVRALLAANWLWIFGSVLPVAWHLVCLGRRDLRLSLREEERAQFPTLSAAQNRCNHRDRNDFEKTCHLPRC